MLKDRAKFPDSSFSEILHGNVGIRKLIFENIVYSINKIRCEVFSIETEESRCVAVERLNFILHCLITGKNPINYHQVAVNHPIYADRIIKPGDIVLPTWDVNIKTGMLEMSDESWAEDARVVIWREIENQKIENKKRA